MFLNLNFIETGNSMTFFVLSENYKNYNFQNNTTTKI